MLEPRGRFGWKVSVGLLLLAFGTPLLAPQSDGAKPGPATTFTNPLLPTGPDPWVEHKDGVYYYMNTTGVNLTLWKTHSMPALKSAEKRVVWIPPASGPYSHEIWAPEIHFLEGKWYIYFAADAATNISHRIWVVENASADPLQGTWTLKGKVSAPSDKWAIDPSVFEDRGKLYLIWSGWEEDENGTQSLYIARLKNPWTVEGVRGRISTPEYPWEKVGDVDARVLPDSPPHIDVNEGPELLKHGDKLFLIYSASACWTDAYSLGMLTATSGTDLLNPSSWKKSPRPVFQQDPNAGVYAPGHNSFFKSPDGKQDWILYHANSAPGQGCGEHRSPRAQSFSWRQDGTPDFGRPLATDTRIPLPSGDSGTP
ncbi:MAG TPA: glycoside hydrolase family 43 protein [Terriglobales bacterium]|nr:glycoside hydrolase family 43 protein [Terriglobales bacterium]